MGDEDSRLPKGDPMGLNPQASSFFHDPVMVSEVIEYLAPGPGKVIVDGTIGGGGHAEALLGWAGPGGEMIQLLIGIDRDSEAIAASRERLERFGSRLILKKACFSDLLLILEEEGKEKVDGVLLDLGASRHQLTTGWRGASLFEDGPLDMRMDPEAGETAAELLARTDERSLTMILRNYGEERHSRRIARAIVDRRERGKPVKTTAELRKLVESAVPGASSRRIHSATRTFMALRIAVNQELTRLERGLALVPESMARGGRAVVISYHSLEDRLVKECFSREAKGCICPPSLPECRCGRKQRLRVLTRRVVRPAPDEVAANPAARSARLRAAERVEPETLEED